MLLSIATTLLTLVTATPDCDIEVMDTEEQMMVDSEELNYQDDAEVAESEEIFFVDEDSDTEESF